MPAQPGDAWREGSAAVCGVPDGGAGEGHDAVPIRPEGLWLAVELPGPGPGGAVAILMQESIVGEKRSGTAAWIHSKPVSRLAFILATLVPNAVGVLATMILIPSVVLLMQLVAAGVEVSAPGNRTTRWWPT